jgi:hypothetical protein
VNLKTSLGLVTLCCPRSHSGGFPENHNQVVAFHTVVDTRGRFALSPSSGGALFGEAIFVMKRWGRMNQG